MACRSLLQHRLRSALSIIGIICGVVSFIAMISIGEGAKREAIAQIKRLGTDNIYVKALPLTEVDERKAREGLSTGLSLSDVERLERLSPAIVNVAYMIKLPASSVKNDKESFFQVISTSANFSTLKDLHLKEGRFITEHDIRWGNLVSVVGSNVADRMYTQGPETGYIRIGEQIFRIVGILKRYDLVEPESSIISEMNYNEVIFIPSGTESSISRAERGYRSQGDRLSEIIVRVRKTEEVGVIAEVVRRALEVSHGGIGDYQILVPLELLHQAMKTRRLFNIVLGFIAFISLVVGGIGIMNIMLASVSERTREIGIRRAVGASKEHILIQFLTETVVLTLLGGLIGTVIGLVSVKTMSVILGWKMAVTPWAIFLPLSMSITVGIISGLFPAIQASRMDPVVALRQD